MTSQIEHDLARLVRVCINTGVEKYVDWAYFNFQEQSLALGKYADKKLYDELASKYVDFKLSLDKYKRNKNET